MKITREADYALRIVTTLANESEQLDAKSISEKTNIPYRFTLKILRKLVLAGIVSSIRGVNGGYMLCKAPSDITFRDVIETIDGAITINKCLTEPEICHSSGLCRVQSVLYEVQKTVSDKLSAITFADVMEQEASGK